jgi:hypothetical protein
LTWPCCCCCCCCCGGGGGGGVKAFWSVAGEKVGREKVGEVRGEFMLLVGGQRAQRVLISSTFLWLKMRAPITALIAVWRCEDNPLSPEVRTESLSTVVRVQVNSHPQGKEASVIKLCCLASP